MAVKKPINVGSIATPILKWENVQSGDTFEWWTPTFYVGEMLVGATGTWGTASVGFAGRWWEGSPEIALIDLADATIAFTADVAAIVAAKHVFPEIAPTLATPDGTTALDIFASFSRLR